MNSLHCYFLSIGVASEKKFKDNFPTFDLTRAMLMLMVAHMSLSGGHVIC